MVSMETKPPRVYDSQKRNNTSKDCLEESENYLTVVNFVPMTVIFFSRIFQKNPTNFNSANHLKHSHAQSKDIISKFPRNLKGKNVS